MRGGRTEADEVQLSQHQLDQECWTIQCRCHDSRSSLFVPIPSLPLPRARANGG